MKLAELRDIVAKVPKTSVSNAEFEPAIKETLQYLSSPAAMKSLDTNVYWPKWDSPWWRMLVLHELGEAGRIPDVAIRAIIASQDRMPLKIFPIHPHEMPEGLDPFLDTSCICAVGSIYQILGASGADPDRELPWLKPWFTRYQMKDGGLSCDNEAYRVEDESPSSLVGTIAAFEAVLFYSQTRGSTAELEFLDRAAACLIDRQLTRGSQTRHNADEREDEEDWLKPCFPRFYFYDVLRGLTALLAWAEFRNHPLPLAAIEDVVTHLATTFPDGKIHNQRHSFEGTGTWLDNKRRQPATFFPLLEQVSRIGEISPALTRRWQECVARIPGMIERGMIVETAEHLR